MNKEFFKENLPIILILLFSLIIRTYYLILTKNQAEWYDSGEYLSTALHWAFGLPYDINPQRPPLLPLLEAIIFKLGGTEFLSKIILELIPSTLIVLVSYLIVKEMYNKKLALLVALFMSVFWLAIFNTVRLHADILLMLFSFLAVYYFWKGYVKKGKNYYSWLIGIFIALAFLTKLIGALFGFIFLIFLLIIEKFKFLKNKHLWIAFILMLLVILPYLIWQNNQYDTPIAFFKGSHVLREPGNIGGKPIAWYVLNWLPWMLHIPFFILFLIGILTFYTLILSFDLVIKNKNNEKYNDLFVLLWILIPLLYFIFLERDAEDRWLLPIALPLLILVSKGLYFVYDVIKKYQKSIAVLVFIALILLGGYFQLARANETILSKKDSYAQVKEASLWIKENSNEDDIIFSKSSTQMTYYAQRQTLGFGGNETQFIEDVKKYKPRYLVLSIFEPHNDVIYNYPNTFKNSLKQVQAYTLNQQPVLVIYEFKNYDL